MIAAYVSGATLIDAYWKSVRMLGQGLFIGEPLARPFGGYELVRENGRWILKTFALRPGGYRLKAAEWPMRPYETIEGFVKSGFEPLEVALTADTKGYFRVVSGPTEPRSRHGPAVRAVGIP